MRVVKPEAIYLKHDVTPYEFIEKVGRTCYKSEEYITEGSAEKFVAGLVKREHMAMLEHETIYLEVNSEFMLDFFRNDMFSEDESLRFFNYSNLENGAYILSGSFRSFYDLFKKGYGNTNVSVPFLVKTLRERHPLVFGVFEDNSFYFEKDYKITVLKRQEFIDKYHLYKEVMFKHLTHTFLFVCDRGVSHEFVRHRDASFAQESTRYCNYSKDKFGNAITIIDPCFWDKTSELYCDWESAMSVAEQYYFDLIEKGATPEQARTVLPNSLKTELIVTATEEEWQHIINLRFLGTTGAPHPQIKEVMALACTPLMLESEMRVNINEG